MGLPGPLEIGLILLVVLLIFGAKRIPEIARGVGQGIREFKDATNDIKNEIEREGNQQRVEPHPPRQGRPQPRPQPRQQPRRQPREQPQPQARASDAQREPDRQEAGGPTSPDAGPPEPAHADNPSEE